jgi:zeta-carotene desaturase
MKALILGGGMSGLATAINLLEAGIEVDIIEADEIFGGRANSWLDDDGDMIDNALHVFFPYYVNLINFFKKMGIEKNITWKGTDFFFAQDDGNQPVLHFDNYPAPLHTAIAYWNLIKSYKGIPRWKMLASMPAMAYAVGASKNEMDEFDNQSWTEWTSRRGPRGSFKPMSPAIYGLTFTPEYAISAKVMVNWFKKVSASAKTSRVGFANGGLGEIWVGSCLDYIKSKGGRFETGKTVTSINVENGKINNVIVNGRDEYKADIYVSAISPYSLRKVIPKESFKYKYFQDLTYFEDSPSLSIQVWFDRKLTDVDVTFFSTDCIFNTYADLANVLPHIFRGGSMFEMVIAPAGAVRHLPDEVIYEKTIEDIKRLFPAARNAQVKKYRVVRERQGVYRPLPGMEKHRPYQRTPYPNLYLTGDYTKTHVSSGGMEAAIWTANHCSELIIMDKLNKRLKLNCEFAPPKGLTPFVRPSMYAGVLLALMAGAKIIKRLFFR